MSLVHSTIQEKGFDPQYAPYGALRACAKAAIQWLHEMSHKVTDDGASVVIRRGDLKELELSHFAVMQEIIQEPYLRGLVAGRLSHCSSQGSQLEYHIALSSDEDSITIVLHHSYK